MYIGPWQEYRLAKIRKEATDFIRKFARAHAHVQPRAERTSHAVSRRTTGSHRVDYARSIAPLVKAKTTNRNDAYGRTQKTNRTRRSHFEASGSKPKETKSRRMYASTSPSSIFRSEAELRADQRRPSIRWGTTRRQKKKKKKKAKPNPSKRQGGSRLIAIEKMRTLYVGGKEKDSHEKHRREASRIEQTNASRTLPPLRSPSRRALSPKRSFDADFEIYRGRGRGFASPPQSRRSASTAGGSRFDDTEVDELIQWSSALDASGDLDGSLRLTSGAPS